MFEQYLQKSTAQPKQITQQTTEKKEPKALKLFTEGNQ
jgi:hypothetical protein